MATGTDRPKYEPVTLPSNGNWTQIVASVADRDLMVNFFIAALLAIPALDAWAACEIGVEGGKTIPISLGGGCRTHSDNVKLFVPAGTPIKGRVVGGGVAIRVGVTYNEVLPEV